MSSAPAAIAGTRGDRRPHRRPQRARGPIELGAAANLCVFDLSATTVVAHDRLASRSRNTPYAGRSFRGAVRHTLLRGEPVVVDGEARR